MTTITCTVNRKYRKRTKPDPDPDRWWSTFGITTREISSLSVKKRSRRKWYQFSNTFNVQLCSVRLIQVRYALPDWFRFIDYLGWAMLG
jgi:hypothetical protein